MSGVAEIWRCKKEFCIRTDAEGFIGFVPYGQLFIFYTALTYPPWFSTEFMELVNPSNLITGE